MVNKYSHLRKNNKLYERYMNFIIYLKWITFIDQQQHLIEFIGFAGLLVWGVISTLVILCIIGIAIVWKIIMVHRHTRCTIYFLFRSPPACPTRSQSLPLLHVSMQADSTVEEIGRSSISHRTRSHHQFIMNPTYDSCV